MKKIFLKVFLCIGLFLTIYSCGEKCDHLDFLGEDNAIVSLTFNKGEKVYPVTVYQDSLVFNAEYGFDFIGIMADVVVGDRVLVTPDPMSVEDWSSNIDFTVTSPNGIATKMYKYIVHVAKYEKVYEEVAYLKSQAEVDAFGAEKYTKVAGIVIDSGEEDKIRDLSSFNTVEEVVYNLQVKGYYGKSLDGFENLKKVTTFNIKNDSIESLVLPKLEVATNFLVGALNDEFNFGASSPNLKEISCPELTTIKNNFVVGAVIESLEGFSKLSEVGGEVILQGRFTNLKGLEDLAKLEYLTIASPYLISLEGLENLKTVKKTFKLQFCQKLESLQGLNLESVGSLNINNCIKIKDITALNKITNLDNLFFSGVRDLESLEGLHNIKTIRGNLSLGFVGGKDYSAGWPPPVFGIEDLNGLRSLESVGGNIAFRSCYNLKDYSGISGIAETFSGNWVCERNAYNPTLEDFLAEKYTQEQ